MTTPSSWRAVSLDSPLQRSPKVQTPAPVQGKLEFLPLDLLSWEDFERIQWRTMRDVEGLRHAQMYGDRGQSQYGLDVVALSPTGDGVALQSKRYKRFGPAELSAAVKTFKTTSRPFVVSHLIIGVSREIKSTKVVERLAELRKELHPIKLDLWDKQELSRLLRSSPEIVIEFFGLPTAENFCLPFETSPVSVPPADVVAIKEALARTPEEMTGAASLLDEAHAEGDDASAALVFIEEAQARLRTAGFAAHASQYEPRRSKLLAILGRSDEACRQVLEEFWSALDQGLTTTAQSAQRRVYELAKEGEPINEVLEMVAVADTSLQIYLNPLAQLPDAAALAVGAPKDLVRLAVLAGETALANDDREWIATARSHLEPLVEASAADKTSETRLRLLLAEATNDWSQLLEDARKLRLGHGLLSLVTARYARTCAVTQRFEEADTLWSEAAGDACLAQAWSDAATWIFSRRAFRSRWKPFTSDEMLPMQTALRDMGPSPRAVPVDIDAPLEALEAQRTGNLRSAAISAQRALRDAVALGDWVAEGRARRTLAGILQDSDEPELAARHLARAGEVKAIKALGEDCSDRFIDITSELSAPNYWTVATAYRLLATQADLVPDGLVDFIASVAVTDLNRAEAGELIDLRAFATSRYLGAVSVLAGIANRMQLQEADAVLGHFERQPAIEPNHYRHHDADEAAAVAGIADAHPPLRQRAIVHVTRLLARSETSRKHTAVSVMDHHIDLARSELETLAGAGDTWAQEVLAFHDPAGTPPEASDAALARLVAPLQHATGVYTVGTGAVRDSLLVGALPSNQLDLVVAEQLRRARDPHVGTSDRCDYLLAAANLAGALEDEARKRHFADAMECVTSPAISEHDQLNQQFRHKLGAVQVSHSDMDSRDRALYLAAQLATTDDQRDDVRREAYALLIIEGRPDYWPTRALQKLGDAALRREDLGFLVGQGWALRSLASILWANHGGPVQIGAKLADDRDVRVRRALSSALSAAVRRDDQATVRARLAQDPCYSVRAALGDRDTE